MCPVKSIGTCIITRPAFYIKGIAIPIVKGKQANGITDSRSVNLLIGGIVDILVDGIDML